MSCEVEEAAVPGDEDEEEDLDFDDNKLNSSNGRSKSRLHQSTDVRSPSTSKRKTKIRKIKSQNPLRLSSSAPETIKYDESESDEPNEAETEVKRARTSSTISTFSSETDSFNEIDENDLQFEMESIKVDQQVQIQSQTTPPTHKSVSSKKKRETRSNPNVLRSTHSGIKISRKIKRPNVLRRSNVEINDKKTRAKKTWSGELSPAIISLTSEFQKVLQYI